MTSIKFTPAQENWLEVTWTEVEQLPDVVTPAKPALYDADGNVVQGEVPETTTPGGEKRAELKHTSYHPTQIVLLRADAAIMGTPLDAHADMLAEWVAAYVPPVEPPKTPEQLLAEAKAARADKIASIVVTTSSGNEFDGDEKSQDRMSRALAAMDDTDVLPWVLHDNSVAVVGRDELREALRLAGAEMAAIWVGVYA